MPLTRSGAIRLPRSPRRGAAASSASSASSAVTALACALVTAASSPARADEKEECASAAESADLLHAQGRLLAAREQALLCARATCPAVVKRDCDALFATLELTTPSLLFDVRDEAGRDVVGARVTLDGAPAQAATGQAVRVDPGVHVLAVRADRYAPVEQRLVVREGERARPVSVTLARADAAGAGDDAQRAARPVSPFVWILGTLSAASLVGFGVFEIEAVTDSKHFKHTCAPRCSDADVDTVRNESTLGAIAGVAAAAFAGGAAAVWLLDGPVRVDVGASHVGVRVGASF